MANERPIPAPRQFARDQKPSVPGRYMKPPVATPRTSLRRDCTYVNATSDSSSSTNVSTLNSQFCFSNVHNEKTKNSQKNKEVFRRTRSWPGTNKSVTGIANFKEESGHGHVFSLDLRNARGCERDKSALVSFEKIETSKNEKPISSLKLSPEVVSFWRKESRRMFDRASTISINSFANCNFSRNDLACSVEGNGFPERVTDGSIKDWIPNTNGGVWNPGYIGLEGFEKLAKPVVTSRILSTSCKYVLQHFMRSQVIADDVLFVKIFGKKLCVGQALMNTPLTCLLHLYI